MIRTAAVISNVVFVINCVLYLTQLSTTVKVTYLRHTDVTIYFFACLPKSAFSRLHPSECRSAIPVGWNPTSTSEGSRPISLCLSLVLFSICTMGPDPLSIPASLTPNKTPKIQVRASTATTKQLAAPKNIAPSDISSPHELTAFVRPSI